MSSLERTQLCNEFYAQLSHYNIETYRLSSATNLANGTLRKVRSGLAVFNAFDAYKIRKYLYDNYGISDIVIPTKETLEARGNLDVRTQEQG